MGISSSAIPPNIAKCLRGAEKKRLGNGGLTFTEAQEKLAVREEKELQRLIAALFDLHGVIANRSAMHKKKTDVVGWPDFTTTLHGAGVAIEVKIPGKTLDPDQVKVRDRMIAPPNSWQYFVAYSVADVVEILRKFDVIK